MALLLQQSTDKGVVADYHRISDLVIDFTDKKMTVKVASYIGADFRQHEIEHAQSLAELTAMRHELDELIRDANDENEARRVELSDLVNNHPLALDADGTKKALSVFEKEYELELADKFDLPTVYGLLKQLPEFSGAQDAND